MGNELKDIKEKIIQWYGPRTEVEFDLEALNIWEAYDKLVDFVCFIENPMRWEGKR